MTQGHIREVVVAPHPVLTHASVDVNPCDPDVVAVGADLVATMRAYPGCVGLAAPQIGVGLRVFCLDVSGHPKARSCAGLVVLGNPELVSAESPKVGREGCQSVPDLTGDVARARRVVVRGRVLGTGELATYEADAFEARAFQHELDHLAGILFLDRVAGAHAIFQRKHYR